MVMCTFSDMPPIGLLLYHIRFGVPLTLQSAVLGRALVEWHSTKCQCPKYCYSKCHCIKRITMKCCSVKFSPKRHGIL